jgi:anti-anti-sigma regulatory factor/anti-sigma regulatory factor (Ser/Thr protein kinase)
MGLQLSVEVEHTHPVAVLRPRGVLDAVNVAELRSALLECIVDQPSAAVIDASALRLGDDVALTALAAVARQTAEWPGTRIALAGASAEVDAAAERLGVGRYLVMCPDRESAVSQLRPESTPPTRRERIEPDRNAPGLARSAVAEFCQELGVREHDAAQLVASELVTNAVVHARTTIDLTLRFLPPLLHIAVRDRADGIPRMSGIIDESSESGRGLLLVDALAMRWGSLVPHGGKVVWAVVRLHPSRWNGSSPLSSA